MTFDGCQSKIRHVLANECDVQPYHQRAQWWFTVLRLLLVHLYHMLCRGFATRMLAGCMSRPIDIVMSTWIQERATQSKMTQRSRQQSLPGNLPHTTCVLLTC